ncbi:MAG: DnaB-like helicase C-terminal domain-containing protein [Bacteroidota bacterium]
MNQLDLESFKASHPIKEVALQLGLYFRGNCGRCFKHEDKHPSLVYMPDYNRFECKACSVKGDVIDLVSEVKGLNFKEAIQYLDSSISFNSEKIAYKTAQEYINSRGLSSETLLKFNIRIENNRVVIPLPTGNKYRIFNCDTKFTQDPGTTSTIFKTSLADKEIILCEGELDAVKVFQETNHSAWSGTGGAETFMQEWISYFQGVEKIFICYDNDEAGRKGTEKVISVLGIDRCYKIFLPFHIKDATEFFQLGGTAEEFKNLIQTAKPCKSSIFDLIDETSTPIFQISLGFKLIDEKVKFEAGNAYLIGGCEKSGKSAFCMNIANNLLINKYKISYVNTEFTQYEFLNRLTGIYMHIPYSLIELNQKKEYVSEFKDYLLYLGIGQDEIKFEILFENIKRHIKNGVKVVFFDNVTTFANNPPHNTEGWVEQARIMNELKDLAKENNIIIFVVLHTKDIPIERAITSRIKDIIASNNPSKIFDDTITVMAKPTNANLYGGLRIASQFSGTILIWRPFLKFNDSFFNQTSQIILESFRNAPAGLAFEAKFKGEIPTFELTTQEYEDDL